MKRALRHPYILVGGTISLILMFIAIFAPLIAPYGYYDIDLEKYYEGPTLEHPMGTDKIGRDVYSRVIYGAQVSLGIGVTTRTLSLIIGIIIGCISGYYGGVIDLILQRLVDITMAFPFLLLVISIAAIFSEGLLGVFVALSLVMWASLARLMRSQVLIVKEREYVTAARAYGMSDMWIIIRHILPNSYVPALIWWTMGLAQAIMAEAGLSFLGLGAQPPYPSWGSMINDGMEAFRVAPWVSFFPGAMLALAVLGFNLLGEGLRDVLDVKGTGR